MTSSRMVNPRLTRLGGLWAGAGEAGTGASLAGAASVESTNPFPRLRSWGGRTCASISVVRFVFFVIGVVIAFGNFMRK